MTTKRAQDSPVHRVFLWKELCRSACVFAEFSLSLKDSNFFLVSLDKVDKIDVLLEDSSVTFSKGVRNRVNSQDTTELMPVVDVFFVGPI